MHPTYARHWLIQGLPDGAKAALYAIGDLVEVAVDDIVIEADRPNGHLYLLLEGAFKVHLPARGRRSSGRTLAHRGPGDLLGEYSFMDDFQPMAGVSASTPGLMLRIDHDALRELLDGDIALGAVVYRNLLAYLVVRLRSQDEEIACLMM
ncbi:MAG: Crp/Fnr family transcriptional regulator [Chromatiaceae bacterium]|nr:Crp/Fnr family transcriptional regulator [Gammaproteobacteria bacterium]MCP5300903.1 Crp/Fnr family transcriptional regulator [Chromatiaceae bacterium]MCP5421624.1 Crp/Fnr family transcriptional regulator [Chromatiaceae bacterium]